MTKNIKVKEKGTNSIRKLDRRIAFTSRVKRNLIEQHKKIQEQEENQTSDDVNATNYATNKVIRTSDRGTRESAYVITDVSKTTYKKLKMKLAENKLKKDDEANNQGEIVDNFNNPIRKNNSCKSNEINNSETNSRQKRLNKIKTRDLEEEKTKISLISEKYQTEKLVKDKQDYKNIKQHSTKDIGIKENNKLLKIKTREKIHDNLKLNNFNNSNTFNPGDLMKKTKIQELNQKTGRIKEITKKTGRIIVNLGKKIAKRTKRNRNVDSFWRWIRCTYNYGYSFNGRNVWICFWIFIF